MAVFTSLHVFPNPACALETDGDIYMYKPKPEEDMYDSMDLNQFCFSRYCHIKTHQGPDL